MINTIRYDRIDIVKDGKKKKAKINARNFLLRIGPLLAVNITHSTQIQKEFENKGIKISSINVNALIDTGASSTIVTPKVVDHLKLKQTGFTIIKSVQDQQERPEYSGQIILPWGMRKDIPLVSCPLKGLGEIDCLIGRDILMHWNLIYNGVEGYIVIGD